ATKREPINAISSRRVGRSDQEPYGDEQMPKVDELISDISNGTLKLPEFQRGYIWTPQQVRTYVQSLYRWHPTGHFLVWHTTAPVKTRGDNVAQTVRPTTSLLLDGQQRLTSMYALIKVLAPPFYEGDNLF